MEKRQTPNFLPAELNPREAALGWLFVPVFAFLVPLLLGAVVSWWPVAVSDSQKSTVYYLIGYL